MKGVALLLFAAAVLSAKENALSSQEVREGWIVLFDGESLTGWTQDPMGKWKVADGTLSFDGSAYTLLRTAVPFADFTLRFDFRAADVDRAGDVFLRLPADGTPADTGYALRHGSELASITKSSAAVASSGVWHTTEVEFLGDHYVIKIDGHQTAEGKDARSKAGYIALEGKSGSKVEYRNIRLKPVGMKRLFNGSELAGWKSVNALPVKAGGGANPLKKVLKLGGGPPKTKEANWSVAAGQIRGTGGPGQLETEALYDDFVLQLELQASGKKKKEVATAAVYLRGEPGQLFSGYKVENGGLANLKGPKKSVNPGDEFLSETIVARDRTFEIWVNGYPLTEYTDPRADSASARKGSRVLAGSLALEAPVGDEAALYRKLNLAVLPKSLGGDMKPGAPPPMPVTDAAAKNAGGTATAGGPLPQAPVAPGIDPAFAQLQAKEEQRKAKVSALTSQALQASDPQRKLQLNQQILTLDPTNMVALQNYNEAKAKIEAASAQQQKQTEEQTKQQEKKATDSAQFSDAMSKGEAAIVSGNLMAASRYLSMAERLSPGNPQVQNLRNRIDSTINFRSRLQYALTGAGAIALLAAIGLWWRTRGKKVAYLEVTEGMDKGKRYPLDQNVTHIGAVPQDGGAKNEIVVRDLERMVSRFHCEVHNQNGKLFLVDCNSSNGTSLNGKKAEANKPMRLKSGSVVQLGRTCALRLGFEKQKKS